MTDGKIQIGAPEQALPTRAADFSLENAASAYVALFDKLAGSHAR